MPRVRYEVPGMDARSASRRMFGRGFRAAGLVVASTGVGWLLLAAAAQALGVPTNTSPPTIVGTPQVGQTLTEVHGSWTNQPTSYSYHWGRCSNVGSACVAIGGATDPTYTLRGSDVGHTIIVKETAHNSAGASKVAISAPTAVVSPAPQPSPGVTSTTTTLVASPGAPVANEAVTLIAAVTSSDSAAAPSGTVTFMNGGEPIPGCADQSVTPVGQTVVVTCQTWFGASTAQLTAAFSPSAGATMTGSASPTVNLAIGRDTTATSLDASRTVGAGASTTYTATVNSSPGRLGTLQPTGTVEFFDGGQAIGSCSSQPLTDAGATCTVTYKAPGSHSITAQYRGDANFGGSWAEAEPVRVIHPPPHVLGFITSTMQWTFYSTSTYTKVVKLVVNGASGATVTASCHGHGCPFTWHTSRVNKTRRCAPNRTGTCPSRGAIDLAPGFHNRSLPVGAQVSVAITRSGWVGKYYQFTVRARRSPRVRIACLAPGATRPGPKCQPRG